MDYKLYLLENYDIYNIIFLCIACIFSYLIGIISPATIIAKRVGVDIRSEGSSNPGTTNILRTIGLKEGILTLIVDFGKGLFVTLACFVFFGSPFYYYGAIFVILGHCFPIVYRFKGGKGVATTFGVIILLFPLITFFALLIFLFFALITRKMSLSVLMACFGLLPLILFFSNDDFIFVCIIVFLLFVKHIPNIGRILHGEEPDISFGKPKKEEKEYYQQHRDKSEEEYMDEYLRARAKSRLEADNNFDLDDSDEDENDDDANYNDSDEEESYDEDEDARNYRNRED